MKRPMTFRRFAVITAVWTIAAISGLTVALIAVGLLGLWVAVGAVAGLVTTVASGWLGQFLFATDLDAVLASAPTAGANRDKSP
jgi:hypothetical protein